MLDDKTRDRVRKQWPLGMKSHGIMMPPARNETSDRPSATAISLAMFAWTLNERSRAATSSRLFRLSTSINSLEALHSIAHALRA